MKDIRLIVKIKNNRLVRAREKLGLTQSDMAEACGIGATAYGDIENLKEYPITKKNEWNEHAKRIASFIGEHEDILFPEAFKLIQKNKSETEIGMDELEYAMDRLCIEGPEDYMEKKQLQLDVDEQLSTLTPREQAIIRSRFGFEGSNETLKDLGYDHYISRDRVRQIEAKALRKLRHPSRSKALKEYV